MGTVITSVAGISNICNCTLLLGCCSGLQLVLMLINLIRLALNANQYCL